MSNNTETLYPNGIETARQYREERSPGYQRVRNTVLNPSGDVILTAPINKTPKQVTLTKPLTESDARERAAFMADWVTNYLNGASDVVACLYALAEADQTGDPEKLAEAAQLGRCAMAHLGYPLPEVEG